MSKPKTVEKYQDMSLRDYFAAAALPAYVLRYTAERAAKKAYEYADAMLAAREGRKNETQ